MTEKHKSQTEDPEVAIQSAIGRVEGFIMNNGRSLLTALIVVGCVIQGETRHFDYVCQGVTQGVTQLMLSSNMPVAFGVLTTENLQQAIDRAGGKYGNKGDEAAMAAIRMVALQIEMAPDESEDDRKKVN